MKTPILLTLAALALAALAVANPGMADTPKPPFEGQLDKLDKKVDDDLSAGALTKPDRDDLKREIGEIRSSEEEMTTFTAATRRDIRQKVAKIQKDLDRDEAVAKAMTSASPTP